MAISAIVLTKNEESKIKKCLLSLKWCDEIIIIDNYSKDKTLEIVQQLGVRIYQRELNNDFSSQRNFGLKKAKNEWIFFVDADEKVPQELAKEIKTRINKSDNILGFYLKRKVKFQGKWLNFGETANTFLLRLGKKEAGKWQGKVHERWQVEGKTVKLKTPLIHDQNISLKEFVKKINFYSTLRTQELYENGKRFNFVSLFSLPLLKFLNNYFLRLGFLDAVPGLILALLLSYHSFLVRAKLFFLEKASAK